jgi:hypothetical protein
MSMPSIPNITPIIDIDREDAFNLLLASIALEEMGLAHIINAEGEKIQYVLNSELHKSASIAEVKEINMGVERIIRETMKLQMLLQEKLESVMNNLPKTPNTPCVHPNKCRPACILTGYGKGQVSNKSDSFHCGTACVESSICRIHKDCVSFSLKYTLQKESDNHAISALLLAIPESVEIQCPNKLKPCTVPEEPNTFIMRGQGVMSIRGTKQKLVQCSVPFTLKVWDFGCNKKFQMITCSSNPQFNHNSGVVLITSGNLNIKNITNTKRI